MLWDYIIIIIIRTNLINKKEKIIYKNAGKWVPITNLLQLHITSPVGH